MFICRLIRLQIVTVHTQKNLYNNIGSTVDLVDAVALWHVMARVATESKKKKKIT